MTHVLGSQALSAREPQSLASRKGGPLKARADGACEISPFQPRGRRTAGILMQQRCLEAQGSRRAHWHSECPRFGLQDGDLLVYMPVEVALCQGHSDDGKCHSVCMWQFPGHWSRRLCHWEVPPSPSPPLFWDKAVDTRDSPSPILRGISHPAGTHLSPARGLGVPAFTGRFQCGTSRC